ncbi:MAG: GAF domain-containing protein [Candidatus Bipolaricaulaceae bacterium]
MRLLGFSSFAELAEWNLTREGFAPETLRSEFLELVEGEGEVSNYQAVWLKKDGEKVCMVESARAVRDETGRTLYYEGTVQDITALRRHEERLSAMETLGRSLVLARNQEEVGQVVVSAASRILGLADCQIFLTDKTGQNLVLIGNLLGSSPASPPPAVMEVAKTGRIISHLLDASAQGEGLHLPLKMGDRTMGVLSLRKPPLNKFGSEERKLAKTLADVAAIALENACLLAEAKEAQKSLATQMERLLILHQISQNSVVAGWDMEAVVEVVYEGVAKLMPAEAFVLAVRTAEDEAEAVFLMDEGGRYLLRKIPKGEGLTWHVLSSEESLYIPDTKADLPFKPKRFGTEKSVRSLLAVPLKVGEKTVGMLSVQSYRPQAYALEDKLFLEMLAPYVAAALENARLIRELWESMERYRRLAENAQDAIYRDRLHPAPGFEYVNPAAGKVVGYSPEEHYADHELGWKIVHPEDLPMLKSLQEESSYFYTTIQFRWRH